MSWAPGPMRLARLGSAEQVALTESDTELAQHHEFARLLDPFGDHLTTDPTREMGQAGDHRLAGHIAIDVTDEADVELEELRRPRSSWSRSDGTTGPSWLGAVTPGHCVGALQAFT